MPPSHTGDLQWTFDDLRLSFLFFFPPSNSGTERLLFNTDSSLKLRTARPSRSLQPLRIRTAWKLDTSMGWIRCLQSIFSMYLLHSTGARPTPFMQQSRPEQRCVFSSFGTFGTLPYLDAYWVIFAWRKCKLRSNNNSAFNYIFLFSCTMNRNLVCIVPLILSLTGIYFSVYYSVKLWNVIMELRAYISLNHGMAGWESTAWRFRWHWTVLSAPNTRYLGQQLISWWCVLQCHGLLDYCDNEATLQMQNHFALRFHYGHT